MTVTFTLNGKPASYQGRADRRLIDILREEFGLRSGKAGCRRGVCGACGVFLGGLPVKACLIPAFKLKGADIMTYEAFASTPAGEDIRRGFAKAGLVTCGYCEAGKVIATEALLSRMLQPGREDIDRAFSGTRCRCTPPGAMTGAVLAAAEERRRRLYGRS